MHPKVSRRAKPLAWAVLACLYACSPASAEEAAGDFGLSAAFSGIPSLIGDLFGGKSDQPVAAKSAPAVPTPVAVTAVPHSTPPATPPPQAVPAVLTSRAITAGIGKTPPPAATAAPIDSGLSEENDGNLAKTRFLIGVERAAKFQVSSLTNPNRVLVDITGKKVRLPSAPDGKAVGLVESFQAGIGGPDRTRVVINVTEPVVVESARLEPAGDSKDQVLAIEFVRAEAEISQQTAHTRKPMKIAPFGLGAFIQPPMPQPAKRPEDMAAKAFKPIIVIDPGHGGHDSGAQKNGAVEKDVVLAFSKVLRDKINATGRYRVVLTRDSDVFIELGERVSIAERNKANLFIAVHADYATTRARGATIYSLRDRVATELRRSSKGDVAERVLSRDEIAAVEQASGDVGAVKNILADLAMREVDATQERTSVFARTVVEKMGTTTNMRDDPEKSASFRVLKTQQFPSVLIELAYVTNKEDAELLQSIEWRNKVAGSIVNAVENYFSHQVARFPM